MSKRQGAQVTLLAKWICAELPVFLTPRICAPYYVVLSELQRITQVVVRFQNVKRRLPLHFGSIGTNPWEFV